MKTQEKQIEKIFDQYTKDLEVFSGSDELGSCQYKTIEDTYKWALALLNLIGQKPFEEMLSITYDKIDTLEEFKHGLYKILIDERSIPEDNIPEDNWPFIKDEYPEAFNHETKTMEPEDYTEITRNQAWDLWSAAASPFHNFIIENPIKTPTYGPIFNVMAQQENFQIGIELAYLTFLFQIPLSTWDDYDT